MLKEIIAHLMDSGLPSVIGLFGVAFAVTPYVISIEREERDGN